MKRIIWCTRLAWIFYFDQLKWAIREFRKNRQSIRSSWQYARGVSEMLDDEPDLTPADALDLDRQYWEG